MALDNDKALDSLGCFKTSLSNYIGCIAARALATHNYYHLYITDLIEQVVRNGFLISQSQHHYILRNYSCTIPRRLGLKRSQINHLKH